MDELIPISPAALWGGRILSGLAVVFLLFDGVIKLIPLDVVVETSRQLGIPADIAFMLGVLTLIGALPLCLAENLGPRRDPADGLSRRRDLRACPCRQSAVQPHAVRCLPRNPALGRTLSQGRTSAPDLPVAALTTDSNSGSGRRIDMTTLTYIAVGLAVLIAIFLIVAAMRPNSFRIERSIDIHAPADKIFPLINDYKHWGAWSPYENVDPGDAPDLQRRAERQGGRSMSGPATRASVMAAWRSSMRRRRRRSSSSWISSARSRPTTSPSSPCVRRTARRTPRHMSPGRCTVPRPIWRKSCTCSSTWIGWSAASFSRD